VSRALELFVEPKEAIDETAIFEIPTFLEYQMEPTIFLTMTLYS